MSARQSPTYVRRGDRAEVTPADPAPADPTPIDLTKVHRQSAALVRDRWPQADPHDIARRVVMRLQHEQAAGRIPADPTIWVRSATYQLAMADQRADRGDGESHRELTVLLRELATPTPGVIRPELLQRALGHVMPRDIAMLRLRLLGHSSATIAPRFGIHPIEVDRAYDRGRARLRAAIDRDSELAAALRRAAVHQATPTRYPTRRPRPRRPVLAPLRASEQGPGAA